MSLFLIAFSVAFLLQGLTITRENALFPTFCGFVVLIGSVITLVGGIKKSIVLNKSADHDTVYEISWDRLRGPILTTLVVLVYLIIIKLAGFYIATAIFMPVYLIMQNIKKPVLIISLTVGTILFIYFIFARLLELHFPTGILF